MKNLFKRLQKLDDLVLHVTDILIQDAMPFGGDGDQVLLFAAYLVDDNGGATGIDHMILITLKQLYRAA